jgi:hypothetical protein
MEQPSFDALDKVIVPRQICLEALGAAHTGFQREAPTDAHTGRGHGALPSTKPAAHEK